jgi:hypothetical protein
LPWETGCRTRYAPSLRRAATKRAFAAIPPRSSPRGLDGTHHHPIGKLSGPPGPADPALPGERGRARCHLSLHRLSLRRRGPPVSFVPVAIVSPAASAGPSRWLVGEAHQQPRTKVRTLSRPILPCSASERNLSVTNRHGIGHRRYAGDAGVLPGFATPPPYQGKIIFMRNGPGCVPPALVRATGPGCRGYAPERSQEIEGSGSLSA